MEFYVKTLIELATVADFADQIYSLINGLVQETEGVTDVRISLSYTQSEVNGKKPNLDFIFIYPDKNVSMSEILTESGLQDFTDAYELHLWDCENEYKTLHKYIKINDKGEFLFSDIKKFVDSMTSYIDSLELSE